MAGHSKWANIKHRKAAQDAKKGREFQKHIRAIMVAAREGELTQRLILDSRPLWKGLEQQTCQTTTSKKLLRKV